MRKTNVAPLEWGIVLNLEIEILQHTEKKLFFSQENNWLISIEINRFSFHLYRKKRRTWVFLRKQQFHTCENAVLFIGIAWINRVLTFHHKNHTLKFTSYLFLRFRRWRFTLVPATQHIPNRMWKRIYVSRATVALADFYCIRSYFIRSNTHSHAHIVNCRCDRVILISE